MDNCGGHKVGLNLPGVQIITLPPRCTAQQLPLDPGIIANTKARYCSFLLRTMSSTVQERANSNNVNSVTKWNGRHGIRDGCIPHVGDAMDTLKEPWRSTTRFTAFKCWIKCLST